MRIVPAILALAFVLAPLRADEPINLDGHTAGVRVLVFTADGKSLVSGGYDGSVRVWDVHERRTTQVLMPGGEVRCLALSRDGKLIAAATGDGCVRVWQSKLGTEKRKFQAAPGRAPRIMGMGFFADHQTVAVGFDDGVVKYFDAPSGRLLRTFTDAARLTLSVAAVQPSLDAPVIGTPAQKLLLLDAASGQVRDTMDVPEDFPTAIACSEQGSRVAVAAGMVIRVYRPDGGVPSVAFAGHSGPVEALSFTRDGLRMASCARDQTARVWDTAGGQPTWKELIPGAPPLSVAISPEGNWIAVGDAAGKLRVWKLPPPGEGH